MTAVMALVVVVPGAGPAFGALPPDTGGATAADAGPGSDGGTDPALADQFVTRAGSTLQLNGETFRFGGANIYWLGLDENVGGVAYPTYFRIDNALRTAKAMGATVVRSHTLGISTGNPLSFEPTLGQFNPTALATIDYAVARARQLGIRLVVPLADNWAYYHGGRADFTNWFGLPADAFYTDPRVIAAFQEYIRNLLTHVNPYTGRAYADEPTVLAWELGNELQGMTPEWVDTIAAQLHQLSPRILVAAPGISPATVDSDQIDIVDAHYYPPSAERMLADAAQVTAAGKVYIAGEYGSTMATPELLQPLAADPRVTGTIFWSLFGHNDTHGFVEHNDGFTLHYPGDTPAMRRAVQAIEAFNRAVNPTARTRGIRLGQPLLTSVTHSYGITLLAWRGTAGAVRYTVQRSTRGPDGPWSTVSDGPVTDRDTPWIDRHSLTSPAWYRVIAHDAAGHRRLSEPVHTDPRQGVLVDPLSSWTNTAAHTDDLVVRPEGDRVAVLPAPGTGASATPSITWSHLLTVGFSLDVTAPNRRIPLTLLTSVDGQRWTRESPRVSSLGDNRYRLSLDRLAGVRSVRVEWRMRGRDRADASRVAVTAATLRYAEPAVTDELSDWSETASRTEGLGFDAGNPGQFGGDSSRVSRTTTGPEHAVWRLPGMTAATAVGYFWPDEPVSDFAFATSADGQAWTPVQPEIVAVPGNWIRHDYTLTGLRDANYLRVTWTNAAGQPWTPQLSRVELYGPPTAVPAPSPFAQQSPAAGATMVGLAPRLSWSPAARAAYYTLVVSTNPDLSNPTINLTGLSDTSYTPPARLAPNTTYYWSVSAVNITGTTVATNAVASFTTFDPTTMPLPVEDFSGYGGSNDALRAAYVRNTGGDEFTVSLESTTADRAPSMAVNYTIGTAGYAGASRTFAAPQDWSPDRGLRFWLAPDPTLRPITVQFQAAGVYWETTYTPTSTTPGVVSLPFSQFQIPSWAQPSPLDLTQVTQLSLYVGGAPGTGTFYVDSFEAYPID
ncbi:MAG TPA: carbohydrate binding domain-containing protein [Micromonosporaceae bacterium]|nr:carbohydrate binding domain-containing protein [Micromonosporaceae bacterium]